MKQPLTEAWAEIARLQNSRTVAKSETNIRAFDLMIDRQLDRIAADQTDPDDPIEVRRLVASANRRERHRRQLVYRYGPTLYWGQLSPPSPEVICAGRQALGAILEQSSPEDASLLLSVGLGEAPQIAGLTNASGRKRLGRLRARLAHLVPYSTQRNVEKLPLPS